MLAFLERISYSHDVSCLGDLWCLLAAHQGKVIVAEDHVLKIF